MIVLFCFVLLCFVLFEAWYHVAQTGFDSLYSQGQALEQLGNYHSPCVCMHMHMCVCIMHMCAVCVYIQLYIYVWRPTVKFRYLHRFSSLSLKLY